MFKQWTGIVGKPRHIITNACMIHFQSRYRYICPPTGQDNVDRGSKINMILYLWMKIFNLVYCILNWQTRDVSLNMSYHCQSLNIHVLVKNKINNRYNTVILKLTKSFPLHLFEINYYCSICKLFKTQSRSLNVYCSTYAFLCSCKDLTINITVSTV